MCALLEGVHGHSGEENAEKEELETYRQAMETVIAEATRLHAAGVSAEDAGEQADFGDLATWSLSASQGSRAIQRVYMELNGELPGI